MIFAKTFSNMYFHLKREEWLFYYSFSSFSKGSVKIQLALNSARTSYSSEIMQSETFSSVQININFERQILIFAINNKFTVFPPPPPPHLHSLQVDQALLVIAYKDGSPASLHLMGSKLCEVYWGKWLGRLQEYREMEERYNARNTESREV